MKAVIIHENGGADKLQYVEDFPTPSINSEEVLVRVKACALNHLDLWVRNGLPTLKLPLPHVLGCDASGTVEEIGAEVRNWKKGDAVVISPGNSCWQCGFCKNGRDNLCHDYTIMGEHVHGGYAEFVKVHAKQLLPKPANISFEEAAAYPLAFVTAWHMLVTHGKLEKGKTVLILGAGSGVGAAAVQIAKYKGAAAILGTSSSQGKLEHAKQLGLTHGIMTSRETPSFYREVLKATLREGVDIVFEHIGPATMPDSIKSVKKGGIVVTCGATTGPQAPVDLRYFFTREIRLQGSLMGTLAEMEKITKHVASGELKITVDSVIPLKEAKKAHEKLESRDFFGKIVLKVD